MKYLTASCKRIKHNTFRPKLFLCDDKFGSEKNNESQRNITAKTA